MPQTHWCGEGGQKLLTSGTHLASWQELQSQKDQSTARGVIPKQTETRKNYSDLAPPVHAALLNASHWPPVPSPGTI